MKDVCMYIALALGVIALIFELSSWNNYPDPDQLSGPKALTSKDLSEKQMNVQKYHNMGVIVALLAVLAASCGMCVEKTK